MLTLSRLLVRWRDIAIGACNMHLTMPILRDECVESEWLLSSTPQERRKRQQSHRCHPAHFHQN